MNQLLRIITGIVGVFGWLFTLLFMLAPFVLIFSAVVLWIFSIPATALLAIGVMWMFSNVLTFVGSPAFENP